MIKPLFGIDCTENKDNEVVNIDRYCVQRTSPAMKESLKAASQEAQNLVDDMKLPKLLRWIQIICGWGAFILIVGILKSVISGDGPNLYVAYQNAPGLFWTAAGCLLVWGTLLMMASKRVKSYGEKEETALLGSKLNSITEAIYQELGVPVDALEVDVPICRYKIKKDAVKQTFVYFANTSHINGSFRLFAMDDKLYFVNLECKYAVPISVLTEIRKVDKAFSAYGWIKDAEYNEEPYAQYKINVDKNDVVRYKPYYELVIRQGQEEWAVEIPPYELPAYESVTGMKAITC